MGIYARSDNNRGVHKAPANEVVANCTGLFVNYNVAEQDLLNPKGVNLIRKFPGSGIRVWGARTASGKKAKQGRTIAVDKRKIKLGSKVQINGKTYVAEDVGGGVKGKHIDVFFKSHKQTKRFGKKTGVKVYKVN